MDSKIREAVVRREQGRTYWLVITLTDETTIRVCLGSKSLRPRGVQS